jgi:hypothetical protein
MPFGHSSRIVILARVYRELRASGGIAPPAGQARFPTQRCVAAQNVYVQMKTTRIERARACS